MIVPFLKKDVFFKLVHWKCLEANATTAAINTGIQIALSTIIFIWKEPELFGGMVDLGLWQKMYKFNLWYFVVNYFDVIEG